MKVKIGVFILSIILSFALMTSGFGAWQKELKIKTEITVVPPPPPPDRGGAAAPDESAPFSSMEEESGSEGVGDGE